MNSRRGGGGASLSTTGIRYGFLEGTTGVYERINRETCEVEMDLKKFFCVRSNLRNDDIIFA